MFQASQGFIKTMNTFTQMWVKHIQFVNETGVDALAVAVGTVHGEYKSSPRLNIQRLAEIKAAVKIPLVLHGGSGLSDDDFRNTIQKGICKVNIFTDLTLAALRSTRHGAANTTISYMQQCKNLTQAVKDERQARMLQATFTLSDLKA